MLKLLEVLRLDLIVMSRLVMIVLLTLGISACTREASPDASASPVPSSGRGAVAGPDRLKVEGTRFVASDGRTFQWRGITAFRLVDYVADGQEAEAAHYLEWASRQGLTVVRVLTMMSGLFDLQPDAGRRALPRVLELAARYGLRVEVVGLANTRDLPVNLEEHVFEIGRILAADSNGFLEIANEPVHPSQSAEVQKPEVLAALAKRVPATVPVALGSIERGDGFGTGAYITWHAPRESGRGGWGHVLALVEGADLLARWKKPVVSDEPIGAGPELQPGRRDNVPGRFRAAALLTRLVGLGATFHYEAGLQARIPSGRELECFNAWNDAWTMLPPDVEAQGAFRRVGSGDAIVADYDRERTLAVYERTTATQGWVLVLGESEPALKLSEGWAVTDSRALDGARLVTVARVPR